MIRVELIKLVLRPRTWVILGMLVALPTLVRTLPPPLKRVIGDLSDTERVLVGLDIPPRLVERP